MYLINYEPYNMSSSKLIAFILIQIKNNSFLSDFYFFLDKLGNLYR